MSIRLQVVMDERELQEIREAAKGARTTVSEWVRRALRAARETGPERSTERKLEAVREAASHSYPVSALEQLLEEIERGYLGGAD